MFCVHLAWPSWPSAAEIVVFGNSLSDTGNVFAASTRDPSLQPDPPSPPYSQERMSYGRVWVKQSADVLDKVLTTPRKLLICGGKVPISKSNPIVAKMIELAGGANGRLAVIPTAKRSNGNLEAWTSVGIGSAFNFHAADRDEANSSEFYSQLDNATAVWIEGGSQGELEDRYIGTATEIALYRLTIHQFLTRGC